MYMYIYTYTHIHIYTHICNFCIYDLTTPSDSPGCVYLATQWDTALRATEGELPVLCASLLLVTLGELAREVTARAQRVELGSRTIKGPQVG